jgi:S-DNA-T family DNA segregation ATPase FtsK/SpoIIIE
MLIAVGPRRRLWERRDNDPDALALRIGIGDLPANVTVVDEQPTVRTVPVVLPLATLGVVGIAGPKQLRAPLARWLVGQAAVLHSPQELSIVVLTTARHAAASEPEWGWVRWLPHLRPTDGQACVALIGTDLETSGRRVAELAAQVERRVAAATAQHGLRQRTWPPVLIVLDGARELRRLPGMPTVLDDGPAVGVYAIALDDDERQLPEECRAVVSADAVDPARVTVRVTGQAPVGDVLADAVSPAWAERIGRALAPVRDVSRDEESAGLPSSVRYLDLLDIEVPSPDDVRASWSRGGRSTRALLGQAVEGPYAVDLRTDGPHALVAGTTGAGKSELLQTLIASLAMSNRPDEMTFVLIDYKGGAAFKDCARLPHTVGLVTDLDAHLTARALESLSAELKRREEQLAAAGAKDIEDYLAGRRPGDPPMPRLSIVIDEFASLKAELPEFVTGLVGIAQRGRSLGVHLVLATQRPAGVVSADIKANTNLRIALRVTDDSDSSDVIDSPIAATIARSTPGRAYARTGHGSLTAFQSARVGGRAPGTAVSASVTAQPLPWSTIGFARVAAAGTDDVAEDETDLARLVVAIESAAVAEGIEPGPSPWLPQLPDVLTVDDLPTVTQSPGARPGALPPLAYGLMDLPALQRRAPLVLDLEQGGNTAIIGTQRTGRSSALRTLAAQLATSVSARDVHLYALDFGNNALLPLASLPHCGAVVSRDQPDRVDRLLALLAREVTRRQVMLAADGVADIAEQRASAPADQRLPYLLLFLDRWEGFTATFDEVDSGRLVQSATRLLAEGGAVGLRAVVTGDRSLLSGRTSTVLDHRVVFRLADRNEYGFAGMNARDLPEHLPPGRGFRPEDMTEVQVALLDNDLDGAAQVRVLQERARAATARDQDVPAALRPARVDPLPVSVTVDEVRALGPRPPGTSGALVGAGGDTLGPRWLDVARDGPGLLVAGPMRSGRSTTLMTMTRSLLDQGWNAILLTPRRSPLRTMSLVPGVVTVLDADASAQAFTDAVAKARRPLVVVIDDLELVPLDGPLPQALLEHLASIRDSGEAVIAAGSTADVMAGYRGLPKEIRRSRSGVLLTPQSYTEGETFGLKLPRSTGGPAPAGRGLLVIGGLAEPVQVALP